MRDGDIYVPSGTNGATVMREGFSQRQKPQTRKPEDIRCTCDDGEP
jgi:hypothetical protein